MNGSLFQIAERIISDLPSSRFVRRAFALMALAGAACFAPLAASGQEVNEAEPNNATTQTNAILPGQFGLGVITTTPSNSDYWSCSVTQGDLIFAYVDTQDSASNMDGFLYIYNNSGALQDADTEDGPPGDNSGAALAGVVAASSGNAFYRVGGSGTPDISPYRLYQAVISPSQNALEQEGNDTFASANPMTARIMGGTVSGTDVDFYKVFVSAGQRLVVIMDDNPEKDLTNTDTELSILASDGATTLATGDNVGSNAMGIKGDANAAGVIVAPTTGIYYIRVAHGGDAEAMDNDYRFVVLVDGATAPIDRDTDGVADSVDNCLNASNADQADADGDGIGDVCEGQTGGECGACGAGAPAMIGLTLPVLLVWSGLRRRRSRKMR